MTVAFLDVAAAVLVRDDGREYLLAQRPPGKVYAGYWEFPGGKVEPGESVRAALDRELNEELGIEVQAATPWLTRRHVYPHATVRLHFWRVTAWAGELRALEHSEIRWVKPDGAAKVAPMLPANAPILKALALPAIMGITDIAGHGEDAELSRLETALAAGRRLFQLRDKTLPAEERLWLGQTLQALIGASGAILMVNDSEELARALRAGVHLSSASLMRCVARPSGFRWVGASCHDAAELARAVELGLDYALLGPVLPTASHPGATTLGWEGFARCVAGCEIPVLALGGLRPEMLETARQAGAHGIALMRNW